MARLVPPDGAMIETQIGARVYTRTRRGSPPGVTGGKGETFGAVHVVEHPGHVAAMKAAGYREAYGPTTHVRSGGCRACAGRVFTRTGSVRTCTSCGEEQ